MSDQEQVREVVRKAEQAFPGGVDVLVNNAAFVAPVHRSYCLPFITLKYV